MAKIKLVFAKVIATIFKVDFVTITKPAVINKGFTKVKILPRTDFNK